MDHETAYQAWVKARQKLDEAKGRVAIAAAREEEHKARCAFMVHALKH